MEMPRLNKSVRRIVLLQRDDEGTFVPNVVYKAQQGKKKGSASARPFERSVRRFAKAQSRVADTYLRKHARSNEKRKDGWMKDFVSNLMNSEAKGRKALMKNGMQGPSLIKMN